MVFDPDALRQFDLDNSGKLEPSEVERLYEEGGYRFNEVAHLAGREVPGSGNDQQRPVFRKPEGPDMKVKRGTALPGPIAFTGGSPGPGAKVVGGPETEGPSITSAADGLLDDVPGGALGALAIAALAWGVLR